MSQIQVKNPVTGRVFTVNESEFDSTYAPLGWTRVGSAEPSEPVAEEPTRGSQYVYDDDVLDRKANDAAVNTLYQSYFGRDATQAELDNWGSQGGADGTVRALEDFLKQERDRYDYHEPIRTTQQVQEGSPAETSPEEQLNQEVLDYINGLDMDEAQKVMLRTIAKESLVSGKDFSKPEDIDKLLADVQTQVEQDISPYYERITREEVEDLKNRMSDIRGQALKYQEQSGENYERKLDKTRQGLRARGLTWSGAQRQTLGKEGAIDSAGREGQVPQDRRFDYETTQAQIQQQARDTGLAAERKLGSERMGALTEDFGKIPDPYGQGRDYQDSSYRDLYTPRGTTGTGQYDLHKKRDIEKEKWNRMSWLA